MLFPTPALAAADESVLADIDQLRESLRHQVQAAPAKRTAGLRKFLWIEAWLGRSGNTWEYYRELTLCGASYLPDQDVASWIRFNLLANHQQAQTVQSRLDRSAKAWTGLADFVNQVRLDERVAAALHDVAMTGRVRWSRYEQSEGLNRQQAQRDLRDLVTAQFLLRMTLAASESLRY